MKLSMVDDKHRNEELIFNLYDHVTIRCNADLKDDIELLTQFSSLHPSRKDSAQTTDEYELIIEPLKVPNFHDFTILADIQEGPIKLDLLHKDGTIYIRDKVRNGYFKLPEISSKTKISYSPNFNRFILDEIFDSVLKRILSLKGCTLIHSAGVGKGDKAVLFTAWPHTGKTDATLYSLRNGFAYLSDDHIIISNDGYAYPYPIRLNLFDYNLKTHPWLLSRIPFQKKLRMRLSEKLKAHKVKIDGSSLPNLVKIAVRMSFKTWNIRLSVEDLGFEVSGSKKRMAAVLFLYRQIERRKIEIKEITLSRDLISRVKRNSDCEDFFFRFRNVLSYADPERREEAVFFKKDVNIIKSALSKSRIYEILLPEEGLRDGENARTFCRFLNELM